MDPHSPPVNIAQRPSTTRSMFSRRRFVQAGTATALTAASWKRVYGANARIGLGIIGYGLVGERHVVDLLEQPDVQILAVAEAHRGRLAEARGHIGADVRTFTDFRKLLDQPAIDAVCISTPDHWHALMTMMACAAGKDVYVEKPLSLFVREGRWMIHVAKKHGRLIQVGTQQRSGAHYQQARDFIRESKLGQPVGARVEFHRNLMPGLGKPPDTDPPPELDWEMFSGPAPLRPFNRNRGIYFFRWFWDYSGGQLTNLAYHSVDIVDWTLPSTGPVRVYSTGGRFFLDDNCEVPDTQQAILQYPEWTLAISIRECCGGQRGIPLQFLGTSGSLQLSRQGFEVSPDRHLPPQALMPRYEGGHPVGGLEDAPRERRDAPWRTSPLRVASGDERQQFKDHMRNFLDCIKSRQMPKSDLVSAHRVATALHLANISLRVGRPLEWNVQQEEIVGDPQANQLLERPYRQPWDSELQALIG